MTIGTELLHEPECSGDIQPEQLVVAYHVKVLHKT
jgi:hypothetical protein